MRAQVLCTAVPGIALLSGGQCDETACANPAALNERPATWRLTFLFGWAVVDDALRTWHDDPT